MTGCQSWMLVRDFLRIPLRIPPGSPSDPPRIPHGSPFGSPSDPPSDPPLLALGRALRVRNRGRTVAQRDRSWVPGRWEAEGAAPVALWDLIFRCSRATASHPHRPPRRHAASRHVLLKIAELVVAGMDEAAARERQEARTRVATRA